MLTLSGAATASAAETRFVPSEWPSNFSATGGTGFINMGGSAATCHEAIFFGAVGAPTASFNPSYQEVPNCNGQPLKLNGCLMTFKPGAEIATGLFGGTIDIGPGGCGPMTIKINVCSYSISPKTGLKAEYRNLATGKVEIILDGYGLKYTSTGGCPKGENGHLDLNWVMNPSSSAVQVGEQRGVFLAGEASEEAAKQPRFETELSYVNVLGTKTAAQQKLVGKSTVTCNQAEFRDGFSGQVTGLSFAASFADCKHNGLVPAVVKMNSCDFVFGVANTGPPYAGGVSIDCVNPSDKIESILYSTQLALEEEKSMCISAFGEQSGGSVSYANLGAGSSRTVEANVTWAGMTYNYTRLSGACPLGKTGTYTDGSYSGGLKLSGIS